MKTKQILIIFIPAIVVAIFALFVTIIQYEPLFPSDKDIETVEQAKQLVAIFPDDPIIGNKKAPITVVIFEDYGCAECQSQNILVQELLKKHSKKIKFIWKGLPITNFPTPSILAHEYTYCANTQGKFDKFKDAVFANPDKLEQNDLNKIADDIRINSSKLSDCLASGLPKNYIERVKLLATRLNVQTLPAIFINDKQITTPSYLEEWETILQQELN